MVKHGFRAEAARTGIRPAALLALLAILWTGTSLVAQEAPRRLTLEDAIRLARENNPSFQSQRNDQGAADWRVREAWAAFLPTANARGGLGYTAAGVQRYGTVDFGVQSTDWYSSSYSLSLGWTLDGSALFGVPAARASRRATVARIDAAEFDLESAVTLQYMAALRAREGVEVARRQLERARQNLGVVTTRVETGAAAGTEGKQAEVELGRAEVALIQAEQALSNQKLRLMEQLGVSMGEDVTLASEFEVFEPTWSLDDLVASALEGHPSLQAYAAREDASRAQVRQAQSGYLPQVSVSTGFSGNALQALNEDYLIASAESQLASSYQGCRRLQIIQEGIGRPLPGFDGECGSPELSAETRQQILDSNSVFPFDFTKNPLSVSLQVSVPVFTGFNRQLRVEEAQAASEDARQDRRAEELRLRRAVTETYNSLVSARRVVEIESRNRDLSEQQLEMARQRYALGAASLLELLDAQASMSTAERDYLNAVYDFHQSLAELEAATGRRLRPGDAGGAGDR